jgi:hypothetical protein
MKKSVIHIYQEDLNTFNNLFIENKLNQKEKFKKILEITKNYEKIFNENDDLKKIIYSIQEQLQEKNLKIHNLNNDIQSMNKNFKKNKIIKKKIKTTKINCNGFSCKNKNYYEFGNFIVIDNIILSSKIENGIIRSYNCNGEIEFPKKKICASCKNLEIKLKKLNKKTEYYLKNKYEILNNNIKLNNPTLMKLKIEFLLNLVNVNLNF